MALLVVQRPAEAGPLVLPAGSGETLVVEDTEVLWLRDPRPGMVRGLIWERGGVVWWLQVLEAPAGGWPLEEARGVVAALLAAQGAAP